MVTVTIHQPEFLPWLGFFSKMAMSDIMVLFDCAQYNKQSFQNRNRILHNHQVRWITVPVMAHKHTTPIKEIRVDNRQGWQRKVSHIFRETLSEEVNDVVQPIWGRPWSFLADLNIYCLESLREYLGLNTTIVMASSIIKDLNAFSQLNTSEKNAELVALVGGDRYLSGPHGASYLHPSDFTCKGIRLDTVAWRITSDVQLSVVSILSNQGKEKTRNAIFTFAS